MQQLFADAQAMSSRTGKSFEDIVTIMTAAAQAGLGKTREEMLGVAEQATKMSIAWGVSAEQAGKSLATWQAAMGLTAEQSRHTADVINALSNEMNAEAGEVDQIFTRMGPLLKASGFATQDIAALATAFKAAGAEVEVSGTAMKNFVNVLAAGESGLTDARKSIYKYLQIDPNALQKQLQTDAMGAVMRVLQALQRVRPEERNSIMGQLFGQESLAAIAPLMSEYKTLLKAVSIANGDVAGSVDEEYANRMKTTATSLAKFTQSARNLGVTMGTALLPVVGAVAEGGASVLNVVRDLAQRFPRLTGVVMGAGAGIATLAVGGVALGLVLNVLRTAANGLGGVLLRMNAAQLAAAGGAQTLTFWQRASSLASLSWRDVLAGVGGQAHGPDRPSARCHIVHHSPRHSPASLCRRCRDPLRGASSGGCGPALRHGADGAGVHGCDRGRRAHHRQLEHGRPVFSFPLERHRGRVSVGVGHHQANYGFRGRGRDLDRKEDRRDARAGQRQARHRQGHRLVQRR